MPRHEEHVLTLPDGGRLVLGKSATLMGILNVTPDSFSDGGRFNSLPASVKRARAMRDEGADVLDIGGESTRPGAQEVTTAEELGRVLPAIEAVRAAGIDVPISIDTYKAEVATRALSAGAVVVNDVHGLQRDPDIAAAAAEAGAPAIAMHWDPERDTSRDLIAEMMRYFERTVRIAEDARLPSAQLILDPGFGFGKSLTENYDLLRRLPELAAFGYPLLVGTSRKSMIGRVLDVPTEERLAGTVATSTLGYAAGARIFRVHDVRPNRDALRVAQATLYGPPL